MLRTYRGHRLETVRLQGMLRYRSPSFESTAIAVDLRTMKRWIDSAIAVGELRDLSANGGRS